MYATLAEVNDALSGFKGIDIAKTSNPVPGYGSAHAKILFIGEAPGQKEDEQRKPFVGPAGKLLDDLLQSIGLKREEVYITNVVKFRPPDNREPTEEEKQACRPFLQDEIRLIQPSVLVPLGRHALTQFFTTMSISDAHGKPFTIGALTIFPLYHPAAALHNPHLRETLFSDVHALDAFLKTPAL